MDHRRLGSMFCFTGLNTRAGLDLLHKGYTYITQAEFRATKPLLEATCDATIRDQLLARHRGMLSRGPIYIFDPPAQEPKPNSSLTKAFVIIDRVGFFRN